jgi:GNAT superfamily N-acetyltransferase
VDLLSELGPLALGSRLRRLTERMTQEVMLIYKEQDIDFEPRWFPVYYLLSRRAPISIMDIAKILGISHPAVNQIAGEMIKHEIVHALKDETDKRKRLLALTRKGEDMLPSLQVIWNDLQEAVNGLLDASDSDIMRAIHQMESTLDERGIYARFVDCRDRKLQDSIQIVDYNPALKEHFKRLNLEWIEQYFSLEPPDEAILSNPEESILKPGGAVLFARRLNGLGEEEILGTCALIKQNRTTFELAKMAVSEKARGKKIGHRLMEAAIAKARALDGELLMLETNSRLLPAIHLYRKMGFTPFDFTPDDKPHYERVDMRMRLPL